MVVVVVVVVWGMGDGGGELCRVGFGGVGSAVGY